MAITPETRDYRTFEVRALPEDGGDGQRQCRVEGYAAVFDQETVLYEYDGIQYKEVIDRNAFSGAEMRDVVMNFNHGGKPVARTKNGTLTLTVDSKGLRIAADLGGTEEGRRLYEEIRGGYLDQMSFAFTVNKQEYDRAKRLRRITGFKRIFDVAAVDVPAYDGTSIAARSWAKAEAEREVAEADKRRRLALKLKLNGIVKEDKSNAKPQYPDEYQPCDRDRPAPCRHPHRDGRAGCRPRCAEYRGRQPDRGAQNPAR